MLSQTIDAQAKHNLETASSWIESNCNQATPRPIAKSTFSKSPIVHNLTKDLVIPISQPSQSKNISGDKDNRSSKPSNPRTSFILKFILSIYIIASGFTLIDAFYVAYRIQVTSYTLSIAIGTLIILLGLIFTLPFASSKFNIFRRIVQVLSLAIIGFSLELWINFVPIQWPLLMTGIAIVLIRIYQLKNI